MKLSQGYSNPREIPSVVKQARAALRRYGAKADIRVITFYNMQKKCLEKAFKRHGDLKTVLIVSVRRERRLIGSGGLVVAAAAWINILWLSHARLSGVCRFL